MTHLEVMMEERGQHSRRGATRRRGERPATQRLANFPCRVSGLAQDASAGAVHGRARIIRRPPVFRLTPGTVPYENGHTWEGDDMRTLLIAILGLTVAAPAWAASFT